MNRRATSIPANAHEILMLLRGLPDGRRTVVMVTHDPQAAAHGDRTIFLRDGRLDNGATSGAPALYSGGCPVRLCHRRTGCCLSTERLACYRGRCRWRCGLVLLSIALGVATCVATSVLDGNLETAFERSATPLAGCADLYVSNGDAGVPRSLAERLTQLPGVRRVLPVVIQRIALPELHHRPALLLGVDLPSDCESSCWNVTTRQLGSARFLADRGISAKNGLDRSGTRPGVARGQRDGPSLDCGSNPLSASSRRSTFRQAGFCADEQRSRRLVQRRRGPSRSAGSG